LLGTGCAPAHDVGWARTYLERDPTGPEAGEAFGLLWRSKDVIQAAAPVLRVRPRFMAELY
jgi:hypothetical protein